MAAALNEVAVAAVGGKLHVMGGSVLGFTGPYHQQYDPANDSWRPRALLPRSLDHIGVAVLNGKIYAVGGFIGVGASRRPEHRLRIRSGERHLAHPAADEGRPRLGRRGRARRQDPRHRRPQSPTATSVATHESLRSGDQHLEGARAAAEGARSRRGGRDRRQDSLRRRPLRRLDGQHRSARHLRSRRPTPGRRDRRCRRRAAGSPARVYKGLFLVLGGELPPQHVCARTKPTIRRPRPGSTLAPMPAGRHATGAAVSRRQRLSRGRLAAAGRGRRHRRADRVYLAVTTACAANR